MGVLFMLALSACGAEDPGRQDPVGSSGDSQLPNRTAGRTGALGNSAATSCVEEYTPAAVSNRAFAFDGVVIDIAALSPTKAVKAISDFPASPSG